MRYLMSSILHKIFGLEREQVAGVCRKVHNEVPHEFYPSQNIWTREREREREQVAGVWRKVHNEVPHEFYPSQNIWTRERERERERESK